MNNLRNLPTSPWTLAKLSIGLLITILFLGATSMDALGFLGFGNTASWKEEVQLHDGSKIIVKRSQTYGGRGEIGQSPIKEHTITFALSGTEREITWKDEYSEDVGHSNFDLLALHMLKGTPYLIASAYGCLSYNKWGRPNPPYILFKYNGAAWQRIQLSELPLEFTSINLTHSASKHEVDSLVKQGIASAEMVKHLNSSLKQEQYKTIIRTPLAESALCPDWSSPRYTSPKAPISISPELNGRGKNK